MHRTLASLPRLRHLPAVLAFAAAPAFADVDTIPWPDGVDGSGGPFTGTAIARTGPPGELVDAVMATDGQLVIAAGIVHFSMFVEIATTGTVHDVETLHAGALAVADDRDHLVVAASDGLWTLRLDVNGVFQPTAVDTSSTWQGAKRVVVADVDGDDDEDLVVLLSNGRSIDCKLQTSSGWTNTSNYQWTANFDVLDFAVGEVDGDSSDIELVVNDTRALRIFSPGNTLLAGYASLKHHFDRMAIVRGDVRGGSGECVAWVTANSATSTDPWRSLFLVTAAGATYCDTTSDLLGPMVSGHFDGEAGSDLAFVVDGQLTIEVSTQQEEAPLFAFGTGWGFSLESSSSIAAARPAVADLGDIDDGGIEELVEPLAGEEGGLAIVYAPEHISYSGMPDFSLTHHCGAKPDLEEPPATVHIVAKYPGASNYVEDGNWFVDCTVWRQDDDFGDSFAPSFQHSCRRTLEDALDAASYTDEIEVQFNVADDADVFLILIRVVHVIAEGEDAGEIDAVKPSLLGVYSSDETDLYQVVAEDYEYGGEFWGAAVNVFACGGVSPPRVGGFIRIRRFPPSTPQPASPPTGSCN